MDTMQIEVTPRELANILVALRSWEFALDKMDNDDLENLTNSENYGSHAPLYCYGIFLLTQRLMEYE